MTSLSRLFACLLLTVSLGAATAAQRETYAAFLGDTGTGKNNQKKVRNELERIAREKKLDSIFLLGDNIYTNGEAKHIKEKFLYIYKTLLDGPTTLHSALGNHDVKKCDKKKFDPQYRDKNAYPGCTDVHAQLDPKNRFGYVDGQRYYSVASEGATPLFEVFRLDSNTLPIEDYVQSRRPEDRAQLSWLEEGLSESKAVWKIVGFHNALHTPPSAGRYLGFGGHGAEEKLRDRLEPIFKKHKVDVVFQAHNHFYARMVPQEGVRYFVAGGGGQKVDKHKRRPGYTVDKDGSQGSFHHFVHVRMTTEVFQYCTVDADGKPRDWGSFKKGDIEDDPSVPDFCMGHRHEAGSRHRRASSRLAPVRQQDLERVQIRSHAARGG